MLYPYYTLEKDDYHIATGEFRVVFHWKLLVHDSAEYSLLSVRFPGCEYINLKDSLKGSLLNIM